MENLPIEERLVSTISVSVFGHYLTLRLTDRTPDPFAGDWILSIDGPMRMTVADREYRITPEKDGANPAYLFLLDKTIYSASASDDGELTVVFADGDNLTVPADTYEPWLLEHEDGRLYVSGAGGGLAVWDAGETTSRDGRSRITES
jgi:hypothetical protein